MKINELFSESNSGRGKYSGSGGTFARQRVDPELLNMVAQKSLYDKEVAAAKAAAPKPERSPSKPQGIDNIRIQQIYIPIRDIEHWKETRDKDWALKYALRVGWKMKNLPSEIKQKIAEEEEWQEAVLDMWKIAEYLLNLEYKHQQKQEDPLWWDGGHRTSEPPSWWSDSWAELYKNRREKKISKVTGKLKYGGKNRSQEAGVNDSELNTTNVENNLLRVVKDLAEKNGYDLTGRRLPPRNW